MLYNISAIPTKGLRRLIAFNDNVSMKYYTYKKEPIKNNLSHPKFQFFLRSFRI
jgi:hypothetical protein